MVLIKRGKIFISIRRPHATWIINAQPKDTTTTFTTRTIPSADPLHTQQPTIACVQMGMDGRHPTGRSKVSQTAFWDVAAAPTQQMCGAALSLFSLGVFLLGKHHPELPSRLPLGAAALSSQSHSAHRYLPGVCRRSTSRVGGGTPNQFTRLDSRGVCRFSCFVEQLSPQTSLNKRNHLRPESSECKSKPFSHHSRILILLSVLSSKDDRDYRYKEERGFIIHQS